VHCHDVIRNFFFLGIANNHWPNDRLFLEALYYVILDRAPDANGLSEWTNVLRSGYPKGAVVNHFLDGPERGICGKIH
ncbi:MAG: DUF4214 domain-containing protein, partial [Myxococcota bacterium]